MVKLFTIGCDPEFFIEKNKKYISAIDKIGGSKAFPLPLPRKGFAMQEDNVAVEFNIPPCKTKNSFVKAIKYSLDAIKEYIPDYDISTASAAVFDEDQLNDPRALEFGCDPDFNAWTREMNTKPNAKNKQLRSAGGHVHIGTELDRVEIIRAMDLFVGVPSVSLDPGTLRRQLYGKAGAYRPQKYGVEYRTLSNFWIFHPTLVQWVYEQTQKAVLFVTDGNKVDEQIGKHIQDYINNGNKKAYEPINEAYRLA
jgi:hypothetical protein